MKVSFRIVILLSMILGLCLGAPSSASAQVDAAAGKPAMPVGLQEAFLGASSQLFSVQGGSYTTEYNGVEYKLNAAGLKLQGNGIAWGIALHGIGRGNQAGDVQPPEIVQTEERLEYRRGVVTEWYRDTALGVQQGFDISESPKGNGKLVLHLDLSTDLEGQLNDDGRGISFAGADGQTLRYDGLKAYDANGVEFEAKMVYNPAQVVIQVEERDAAYPITIDPFIFLEQKVLVTDGAAGDNFGYAVAIDGDTAVIGAANDDIGANANQGSAYIFLRVGTIWTLKTKLTALDGAANDYFGCSVAISGDTVLVGARDADIGANAGQGSAYVFVRSGTDWIQQAKLTASDGAAGDVFGWSLALEGNLALVGAPWDDVDKNENQGSAYVFIRGATTWAQQAQITAPDGATGDEFGSAVALSGDTALVGAAHDDVEANADQGSAYVFTRSEKEWQLQQQLIDSSGHANFYSGAAVALSGDTVMVGAPGISRVEVFERSGETWISTKKITKGSFEPQWGSSIALSGDFALVAGTNYSIVEILMHTDLGWIDPDLFYLYPSDGYLLTGFSVAFSDDTAMVGALFADIGANTDQGAAYFFQPYRTNDLAVSAVKEGSTTVYPGDTVYITASVTNYGPGDETGELIDTEDPVDVVLNINLPVGLTLVSQLATRGMYTPSDNSWWVGDLPLGITASLFIEATVDMISAPAKALVFSAEVPYRDTNDANNKASLNLLVKKKERLLNGGFNTYIGASKIPVNWTAAGFGTTDGKDTTAANRKEGAASVKIANTTAKTKTLTQTLPTLSGAAGDPFIFSYWVKGSALPTTRLCQAQVFFYNGTTGVGTKTLPCGSTRTFAYKQKTLPFTAPGAYSSVTVKITYSKASGTVWFDAVSLLK